MVGQKIRPSAWRVSCGWPRRRRRTTITAQQRFTSAVYDVWTDPTQKRQREEHRESAGLTVRHVREIGRRSLDNAAQHFGPESSQRGRVIRIDVDCSEGDRSVRRMLHDCAAFRVDRGSHHVAKAGPRSDWRGAHRPGNLLQ